MNKENYFISKFENDLIGDDGAVINDLIYSKDLFFEDVHFKREWMSIEQTAYKSIIVNISDAVAMNAKPLYILLGVQIPKSFSKKDISKLASGFKQAATEYECTIIGGDTIAGDKLNISVTVVSKSINPIYRKGIKNGDLIAYTGDVGSVSKDLKKLFKGKKISKTSKFFKPELRCSFIYEARRYLTSCMDISDGISFELERLSKINKVGFKFVKKLKKSELCSGEEYELLLSFSNKNLDKIEHIAKKTKTDINILALAQKGSKYECICKPHHF